MAGKFKKSRPLKHQKSKPAKKQVPVSDEGSSDSDDAEDMEFGVNLGDFQKSMDADKGNGHTDVGEAESDFSDEDDDEDDDGIVEALEGDNNDDQSTRKRRCSETLNGTDAVSSKKRKKTKTSAELQKPPTAQEMTRLRETENLFHSNLFRLQIDEMISELSIKKKRITSFTDWFASVKKILSEMKSGKQYELMDQKWLKKIGISVPFVQKPHSVKGVFSFLPPTSVSVMGSYAAGCSLGPRMNVDIAVEMPSKCFQGNDNLNHRYQRKRALYLCHVLAHLKEKGLISSSVEHEPRFELHRAGSPLIPVGVVAPAGQLQGHALVYIHITAQEGTFKLSKLSPCKNSVRANWYFDTEKSDEGKEPATPLHNSSILGDLVAKQNEAVKLEALQDFKNIKDGIILLKVWLRQRELDQGFSSFGSYLMTMLVVYLLRCRKISSHMSSYQVARTTWNYISESDWTVPTKGITLCDKPPEGAPTLSEFHENFEVVFIDCSGFLNLAAHLDAVTFKRVKKESTLAIQSLDDPSINSFQVLFMKPAPFYRRYDHVLCLFDMESLQKMNDTVASNEEKLDKMQFPTYLSKTLLLKNLQKGLGKRVSEFGVHMPKRTSWKVTEAPAQFSGPLLIGMNLDSEHAYSIVDKGPPADTPEANDFRKFWGEKSELRRFQDGSISEAVVWLSEQSVTFSHRRIVNRIITDYILQNKLSLNPSKSVVYLADQMEEILALSQVKPSSFSYGSGEEASLAVLAALDRLSSQLRGLADLPLDISGVQGSSPVCRYADVFPPLSTVHQAGKKLTKPGQNCALLRTGHRSTMAPAWIPPVEVVLQLALSGKWPDDAQAVRRVRAAFSIKVAECLRTQCGLTTQAFQNHVDVMKDGFVFRLRIAYQREPALLRQCTMPDGMIKSVDCKEARSLERETNHLPKLTSYLHGLHQLQPAFGPATCIAKRWVASHMIRWSHFPEEAVELLMASVFLNPAPFSPPAQPQIAFLRFLHLLSRTNWHLEPLVLNFNNELKRDDILDIERRFTSDRIQLPAMFIATPSDTENSLWTKEAPSLTILARVAILASQSLKVLEGCYLTETSLHTDMWKKVFRPSVDSYNLLIHLQPHMNPRRSQWIDAKVNENLQSLAPYTKSKDEKIPVTGYNPIQCYLQELEDAYSDYALFFHDVYGGSVIGVVWKPQSTEPKEFKVTHINGRELKRNNMNSSQLHLNQEALIEDFYILGDGLVTDRKSVV